MKELRKLWRDDLNELCTLENWYTKGTNEEYAKLLNMTGKNHITTKNIVDMANNIKKHSETDCEIETICYKIAKKCSNVFIVK